MGHHFPLRGTTKDLIVTGQRECPDTTEIPAKSIPKGALKGTNDFGKQSYGGPCPPSGTHRYFFKLYALDTSPALKPGATKAQLEEAMKGRILEKAELLGLYRRK